MTEGIVYDGKSLDQLEKEITCAICQEHYTEPKVLPCLHYYCKKCILKLAQRSPSGEPISWPECCQETTLPKGGVEELKTAFFINRFQSHFSVLKRVHGKVEVKCEECSDLGNKAEAFCRQCALFICKECTIQHKRMKSFSSHQVVSLEELKQGTAGELAVKEPPAKKCPTHEEPLIIYCSDCYSLICRNCTGTTHKDHKFKFSTIAAPDTKKKLLEHLSPLRKAAMALSGAVRDIQTTKQEVEAQGKSVANTIHTSFNELQLVLDKHKQQLLQQAADEVQQKVDRLSAQEKSLCLATAEVQSIVDNTEQFVSHCSDNEIMSLHADISRRIERGVEEHSKSERSLEPVEEADMEVEVKCSSDLQQLCQTKAKITLAMYPAKCALKGEGSQTAEVNKTAEVTLTVTNNKTTRCRGEVASELKSLWDGSVIKCNVKESGPGEYCIQYTPTVRGRHELTVSVDGQQVPGSPFAVFVSISPTLLGNPVHVCPGIQKPIGITVNSIGEIIVTTYNNNIVKIDKDGEKTPILKEKVTVSGYLSSVSTDYDNNIYCTSSNSNKIFQCNQNGGDVKLHEVQQEKGPGYRGVAAIGDEVMVTEKNNKGTVLVYDRELIYKRRIELKVKGVGEFQNISKDQEGNLYFSDYRNSVVEVFSNDGDHLRSIGSDKNEMKKLESPIGICVFGPHVYVANYSGHSVSVFTTAGDYVTSFGQKGDKEGDFNCPYFVCVVDNYVYVTDYYNYRVQCF